MTDAFDVLGHWMKDKGLVPGVSPEPTSAPVTDPTGNNNYNDEESWNNYLQVLKLSNDYNSASQQANFDFNEHMRDTQISSIMKQLKENGINPILAVQNGLSMPSYSSSAMANAYSGSTPYSSSSKITASLINAVGNLIGSIAKLL